MRFLIDRCAGRLIADWLREQGHDVVESRGLGPDPGDRALLAVAAFTTRNVTITATLYDQSIPPYYLLDRFSQAPDSPATQPLYHLTSNLQTKGTPIEDWKFQIATASQAATVR